MTQPAQNPAAAGQPPRGILGRLTGRMGHTGGPAPSANEAGNLRGFLRTATPALALAARRAPLGLLVLGGVAAGVALANPKVRARIRALGHQASPALGR